MAKLATTQFKSKKTNIPGLLVFDINFPEDERGYYQENYQHQKLLDVGLDPSFKVVQTNISYNKAIGVTRGLHAEPWNKYLSVAKGRIFVAYVDLRSGESFGQVFSMELDNTKAIFLPEGVANSFQTLEHDTYYLYSVDAHWYAESYDEYCFLNLADPTANIKWPISLDKAIMSDRDKAHPTLDKAKKFKARQ